MTVRSVRGYPLFLPPTDHPSRRPGAAVHSAGTVTAPGRPVRSVLARVREALHRRAVLRELNAMSERELADIGLSRDELHRVFEPGFEPSRRRA